jgi:hypothetical protein
MMNREDKVLEGELEHISASRANPPSVAVDDLWGKYCESRDGSQRRKERSSKTTLNGLPFAIKAQLTLGQELFIRGDTVQAIEVLISVRDKAPSLNEVHSLLGMVYESCGRMEEALACYASEYKHRKRGREALDTLSRTAELAFRIGAHQQVSTRPNRTICSYSFVYSKFMFIIICQRLYMPLTT